MKVYTPENGDLMMISRIERDGDNLVVHGKIMGSLPMKVVIRPEEARKGLKLLDFKTWIFLASFLLRGRKRSKQRP